jgi:hypothetical protein
LVNGNEAPHTHYSNRSLTLGIHLRYAASHIRDVNECTSRNKPVSSRTKVARPRVWNLPAGPLCGAVGGRWPTSRRPRQVLGGARLGMAPSTEGSDAGGGGVRPCTSARVGSFLHGYVWWGGTRALHLQRVFISTRGCCSSADEAPPRREASPGVPCIKAGSELTCRDAGVRQVPVLVVFLMCTINSADAVTFVWDANTPADTVVTWQVRPRR